MQKIQCQICVPPSLQPWWNPCCPLAGRAKPLVQLAMLMRMHTNEFKMPGRKLMKLKWGSRPSRWSFVGWSLVDHWEIRFGKRLSLVVVLDLSFCFGKTPTHGFRFLDLCCTFLTSGCWKTTRLLFFFFWDPWVPCDGDRVRILNATKRMAKKHVCGLRPP